MDGVFGKQLLFSEKKILAFVGKNPCLWNGKEGISFADQGSGNKTSHFQPFPSVDSACDHCDKVAPMLVWYHSRPRNRLLFRKSVWSACLLLVVYADLVSAQCAYLLGVGFHRTDGSASVCIAFVFCHAMLCFPWNFLLWFLIRKKLSLIFPGHFVRFAESRFSWYSFLHSILLYFFSPQIFFFLLAQTCPNRLHPPGLSWRFRPEALSKKLCVTNKVLVFLSQQLQSGSNP